jgi:preprotein translocase subunit SecD
VSPPRSQREVRQRRVLWISVISVVAVAFGWMAAVIAAGWHPLLGLDLNGGLSVVYKPAHTATQTQLNEVTTIMTNRVDALGVSGATVSTQGGNVVVSVPGIKHPNTVLKLVGSTGQLYFRPALCYAPPYAAPSTGKKTHASGTAAHPSGHGSHAGSSTTTSSTATSSTTTTTAPAAANTPLPTSCPSANQLVVANLSGTPSSGSGVNYNNVLPWSTLAAHRSTPPSADSYSSTVLLPLLGGITGQTDRMLLGPGELKGDIVKPGSASAQLDTTTGQWVVDFSTVGPGWDNMTQKYFHEIIGIELDGVIQSAPITQPAQSAWSSFNGQVQISGSFTQQQAQNLALVLNYGALPVRLVPQTVQTVSPTLGKSSLKAGLAAGLVGLALVLFYVILYYRALGAVVVSGLLVTAAALWAIISTLGVKQNLTLDLAGVTGLIVSIGITVDSYIVFFERLKDEARAGRSIRTSVDRGFKSAWRTVFAADMVSLLGAVLLWFIAVGSVRGFAFFLGLSTLLDLIITYFYTRPLVMLLAANERVTEARMIGINEGLAVSGAEA